MTNPEKNIFEINFIYKYERLEWLPNATQAFYSYKLPKLFCVIFYLSFHWVDISFKRYKLSVKLITNILETKMHISGTKYQHPRKIDC